MLNTNVNINVYSFIYLLLDRQIVRDDENVNYFSIQLSIENERYAFV